MSIFELFQRNAAPSDGKEVEVAAFRIAKQIARLHARIERIDKPLRSHHELLSNLRRIHGIGRRLDPVKSPSQRQHRNNSKQRKETMKIASGLHGDPF